MLSRQAAIVGWGGSAIKTAFFIILSTKKISYSFYKIIGSFFPSGGLISPRKYSRPKLFHVICRYDVHIENTVLSNLSKLNCMGGSWSTCGEACALNR